MDVTRTPLAGMMPHLAHRAPLHATVHGGGAHRAAAAMPEIDGLADGPDVVLPTGVRIRRKRIGRSRVADAQLQQAIRGVQALPVAHQMLIARLGIPIELVPVVQLERLAGTTEPVVGATLIVGPDGNARPTKIRIAAYQAHVRSSVTECTQHEIGHAIAVVASQDTSEATAERYARTY
jgi:hypothetical protein